MVEYSNPIPPDHMNRGDQRIWRDLVVLGLGGVGILFVSLYLLMLLGGVIGRMIPFSYEYALVKYVSPSSVTRAEAGQAYELQKLADRLAAHMNLPEDMEITVHYSADPQVNAFATIGGQIYILEGLISRVESENELAMVVAHEIAHIKHRDVSANLFAALVANLFYMTFIGSEGVDNYAFSTSNTLLTLGISREAERMADAAALRALAAEYGHANGSRELFRTLEASLPDQDLSLLDDLEILKTHPSIDKRIAAIETLVNELEVSLHGPLVPLTDGLKGTSPTTNPATK
ncbi:MAG: M48 family metalloprotease [Pseudomonadota bacterium]